MRALVLGGGGAKGAWQAGAISHLFKKYDYDIITGVSVGAINGAYLAQFPVTESAAAVEGLTELWHQMTPKAVLRKWYGGVLWLLPALWKPSVYNSAPLHKMLRTHLDPAKIRDSGRRLSVGAVSMETARYNTWSETDEDIVEGVMASSAFPAFMMPVKARNQWWVDGGARDITPLHDAIRMGATEVDVVCCSPGGVARFTGRKRALKIALDAVNIALDEVDVWDLKVAELYNALVLAKVPGYEHKKVVNVRVLRPMEEVLLNSLNFDSVLARRNFAAGYEAAVAWDR